MKVLQINTSTTSLTILSNILDWLSLNSFKSIPNLLPLSSFMFMPAKNSSIDSKLRNPVLDQRSSPEGKKSPLPSYLKGLGPKLSKYIVWNYINIYIICNCIQFKKIVKFLVGSGKESAVYMAMVSILSNKWYKHTQSKFMGVNKGRKIIYTSIPFFKYAFCISITTESISEVF